MNTWTNVGVALGAAAAGVIIDSTGTHAAFLAAAVALALTATVIFSTRARLDMPSDAMPPSGQPRAADTPG